MYFVVIQVGNDDVYYLFLVDQVAEVLDIFGQFTGGEGFHFGLVEAGELDAEDCIDDVFDQGDVEPAPHQHCTEVQELLILVKRVHELLVALRLQFSYKAAEGAGRFHLVHVTMDELVVGDERFHVFEQTFQTAGDFLRITELMEWRQADYLVQLVQRGVNVDTVTLQIVRELVELGNNLDLLDH